MTSHVGVGQILKKIHMEMMDYWDLALLAKRKKQYAEYSENVLLALAKADIAVEMIKDHFEAEPTRSIICRNAAEIAIAGNKSEVAIKYTALGLSGTPPEDIKEDLIGLFENATHSMHASTRGKVLGREELQISFTGDAVGYGYMPYKNLLEKMEVIENIIYRTAERMENVKFRSKGKVKKNVREHFDLYASVPEASSYSFVIRLGGSGQKRLFDFHGVVIDEILDCISMIGAGNLDALRDRIVENDYYNNFISLVRQLAPDGKDIKKIYFSRDVNNNVVLDKTKSELSNIQLESDTENVEEFVIIDGILCQARANNEQDIVFVKNENETKKFYVSSGLEDVVNLHWRKLVQAKGVRKNNKFFLVGIEEINR